jgi:hypothetical protein
VFVTRCSGERIALLSTLTGALQVYFGQLRLGVPDGEAATFSVGDSSRGRTRQSHSGVSQQTGRGSWFRFDLRQLSRMVSGSVRILIMCAGETIQSKVQFFSIVAGLTTNHFFRVYSENGKVS